MRCTYPVYSLFYVYLLGHRDCKPLSVVERVDLGMRIGKLQDSSMMVRKLAHTRLILCASPDYWHRHGKPQHPDELKHHLGLSYSNITESQLWQFVDDNSRAISVHVPFRMRANNGDVLLKAALDGLGIVAITTGWKRSGYTPSTPHNAISLVGFGC